MASTNRTCKFCGKLASHPEAHIFPRSLYRSEKGEALKLVKLSGDEPVKRSQTGIYDSSLWCIYCERKSSEIDSYVATFFLNEERHIKPYLDSNGDPFVHPSGEILMWEFKNIDPVKLSLFVLSVLWRSSASRCEEVSNFTLGRYQDVFRDVLVSEDQIEIAKFPFLLRYEQVPDMRGMVKFPVRTRYGYGVNFVRFHIGGFAFDVKISNTAMPAELAPMTNAPGRPVMLHRHRFLGTREGRDFAAGVLRANS